MSLSTRMKSLPIYILIIFSISVLAYVYQVYRINHSIFEEYDSEEEIQLRKFPYPYKAGLAICSDGDGTATAEEFLTIQKYLNSRDSTSIGMGLGLEIDNSFFMYDPENNFSWYSNKLDDRKIINKYISMGILDCLHSYGEIKDFKRIHAIKALSDLQNIPGSIDIWTDHSYTKDNIDGELMGGSGDDPDSPTYHTDLLSDFGIKFYWLGRVTSLFVNETYVSPDDFFSILDKKHLGKSFISMTKEVFKHLLAIMGSAKYEMHKDYRLVRVKTLRDNQRVYEFIRTNIYWEGVDKGEDAAGLAYVLSESNLDRLIEKEGYSIIYTHLGKNNDDVIYLPNETKFALKRLANKSESGQIYVSTTSKLLNYYINRRYLRYTVEDKDTSTNIIINGIYSPLDEKIHDPELKDLQGITFYVPEPQKTHLYLNDIKVQNLQINPADEKGRESIMIPIQRIGI